MADRTELEELYVLALLRHDGEPSDAPVDRYANLVTSVPLVAITNKRCKDILAFAMKNFRRGASTSARLLETQLKIDAGWLYERMTVVDPQGLEVYAEALQTAIDRTTISATAVELIAASKIADPAEAATEMQSALARANLLRENQAIRTVAEADRVWAEKMAERQRLLESGAPRFGFPEEIPTLDERIPYVFPGQVVLITAEPGVGKSALAAQIFEHNLRRGFKGAMFRFEDSDEVAGYRRVARQMWDLIDEDGKSLGVPLARMTSVVLSKAELEKINWVRRESIGMWAQNGRDVFCPGWSAERVASVWTRLALQGYDFFVVDYLNKMGLTAQKLKSYGGVTAARTIDVETLKNVTESTGAICVLVQQENPDTGSPYETKAAWQKAQVWMSLDRPFEQDSTRGKAGKIKVLKANMAPTGNVDVDFLSDYLVWVE